MSRSRHWGQWRFECRGFRVRGTHWAPCALGSTNQIWRGSGPSGEWLLKWYKYPMVGVHPEPEVARFLSDSGFTGVPEFGGRLDQLSGEGWMTVAYVQRWIKGRSAWDEALEQLRAGLNLETWTYQLGQRIGQLHKALVSIDLHGCESSEVGTKNFGKEERVGWVRRVRTVAENLRLALLQARPSGVLPQVWERARSLWIDGEPRWRERLDRLESLNVQAVCSRVHGDLHLGQMLDVAVSGEAPHWMFVDFEGEPLRPLQERRALDLPLRDVAGMWRSLAYIFAVAGRTGFDREGDRALANHQSALLSGWSEKMPVPAGDWPALLDGLVWEKAIYEVLYELKHRPDWLHIPLAGVE